MNENKSMTPSTSAETPTPRAKNFTESRVDRIVKYLTSGGDGAARAARLRRPTVFDGVAALCAALPDLKPEHLSQGWPDVAAGVALVGPGMIHESAPSLGRALALAGYAEIRLRQLLSASGPVRAQLVHVALRFLKAKQQRFNFTDAALLLVTQNPERISGVQARIAYDYCQAAR